jgi:hypothetical protein
MGKHSKYGKKSEQRAMRATAAAVAVKRPSPKTSKSGTWQTSAAPSRSDEGVVVSDEKFHVVKGEVRPDERGRITVGQEITGDQQYRVLINTIGQILLDPVVTVPARELWLFRNQQAFLSLARGVDQAKAGDLHYLGSFAKYAEEPDDDEESDEAPSE